MKKMERSDIEELIYKVFDDLMEQNDNLIIEKSTSRKLVGHNSPLDSLGLVNFLMMLEETISDKLNDKVTIADYEIISQSDSPLKPWESSSTFFILKLVKKSKNIIIVGNNRGIGKVLTEHFLNLGHSVIGTSRLKIASIEHENYQHVKVDITKENDLDKLLLVVKKRKTVVNLILNCTALTSNQLLLISEKKYLKNFWK